MRQNDLHVIPRFTSVDAGVEGQVNSKAAEVPQGLDCKVGKWFHAPLIVIRQHFGFGGTSSATIHLGHKLRV